MDSLEIMREARGEERRIVPAGDLSGALAAQSAAAIERVRAEYTMARTFPRDMERIRATLFRECERWEFADAAWYEVPNRGKGLSSYFADEAARLLGNMSRRQHVVFDDAEKLVLRVSCSDLESNFVEERDISVLKTVERRGTRADLMGRGRLILDERKNSDGDTVYIVRALEEEILGKASSAASKARRQCTLQLLPTDLREDCEDLICETRKKPAPRKRPQNIERVLSEFQRFTIDEASLSEWLGLKSFEGVQPAQFEELRKLYRGVKEGEIDFFEELEKRRAKR